MEQLSDEVLWLEAGRLKDRGQPRRVITAYRRFIHQRLLAWGIEHPAVLSPSWRRYDEMAELREIELINERGQASSVWASGENVLVRVHIFFHQRVERPVVGILIRTRIGFEVYGTNTELEQLTIPRAEPGSWLTVHFQFRCDLCPGEYTLTAAIQEPGGAWHDWVEDAVAFTVTDWRSAAGVVNLRAKVSYEWRKGNK